MKYNKKYLKYKGNGRLRNFIVNSITFEYLFMCDTCVLNFIYFLTIKFNKFCEIS